MNLNRHLFPWTPQTYPAPKLFLKNPFFRKALSKAWFSQARPDLRFSIASLAYKYLKVTPDTFVSFPVGRCPCPPKIVPPKPLVLVLSPISSDPLLFTLKTEPVWLINHMTILYIFTYMWSLFLPESTELFLLKTNAHSPQCLSFPLIRLKWKWKMCVFKQETILNVYPTEGDGALVSYLNFVVVPMFAISTPYCSWWWMERQALWFLSQGRVVVCSLPLRVEKGEKLIEGVVAKKSRSPALVHG